MSDHPAPEHPAVELVSRVDRITVAARTMLHGTTYTVTVTAGRVDEPLGRWRFHVATPDGTLCGVHNYDQVAEEHVPDAVERQAQEHASRIVLASARRRAASDEFDAATAHVHPTDPQGFPPVPPPEFPGPVTITHPEDGDAGPGGETYDPSTGQVPA